MQENKKENSLEKKQVLTASGKLFKEKLAFVQRPHAVCDYLQSFGMILLEVRRTFAGS